jgi:DNA-binding transcriptional ArsR family regulator
MVLETLFGGATAAKVLMYLQNYEEGYASGISKTFGLPLSMVQRQLGKFERGGILSSRLVGNSRMFTWNARNPTVAPLRALLADSFRYIPKDEINRFYRERRRPRRTSKSL